MTESLFTLREDTGNKKTFSKTEYMKFTPGQHIIRMLTPAVAMFEHYIPSSRITIKCLGSDECPICKNNKKIFLENPDNYQRVPGWVGRSYRHRFNGLDRTPVKTCPNCQTENKAGVNGQFPTTCSNCNTMIINEVPHPCDKVKLVTISDTNAQQLVAYDMSILDKDGERLGLLNFDVLYNVIRVNNRKTISPSPMPDRNDKIEVPEDALYNLEDTLITLTPDEIMNVLKGVTLRDIFAARRGEAQEEKLEAETQDLAKDIKSKIADLYAENPPAEEPF